MYDVTPDGTDCSYLDGADKVDGINVLAEYPTLDERNITLTYTNGKKFTYNLLDFLAGKTATGILSKTAPLVGDDCPKGDYSSGYYDNDCGTKPTTSVPDTVKNNMK